MRENMNKRPQSLLDIFVATAERYPDSIAVHAKGGATNFRDLLHKVQRAAEMLIQHNVGYGSRIAILGDKDADYIAWMIAALSLGTAYVPLDKDAPNTRTALILQKAHPHLVVSDDKSESEGPSKIAIAIEDGGTLRPLQERFPGDTLAYIIFTSGSTGQPKGVTITHEALDNFSNWVKRYFSFLEQKRILNIASFSFDQSVLDIVLMMTLGCTLVICENPKNPLSILQTIATKNIQCISTVPNTFSFLYDNAKFAKRYDLGSLKTLILGGAPFHIALRDTLYRELSGISLYNIYGPTEATVYCMIKEMLPDESYETELVPLGKHIDNTEIELLDDKGHIVEGAGEGELVIIGNQVMAGYFEDPERTHAAMNLPLLLSRGGATYRTGDIVRRTPNHEYYFVGRVDDQIKTGGYRVNLLEVEGTLLVHPAITEAAVVSCTKRQKGAIMIAYFSVAPEGSPPEIQEWLSSQLPRYMIPHHFVVLKELPRNPSGKIDKAALKAIASQQYGD